MTFTFGTGEVVTGFKMIWTGMKWIARTRSAPWSAVEISATLQPYAPPWYAVRLFCLNERAHAIEILSIKAIRPKNRLLRRPDGDGRMPEEAGSAVIRPVWTIGEKNRHAIPFDRAFFVDLVGMKGEQRVDFELKVRLLNNRRDELPVWVRTNPVKLS